MNWANTGSHADGAPELLFTENESNAQRLWGQPANTSTSVKDAFHAYVIAGQAEAVNPAKVATRPRPTTSWTLPPAAARRSGCVWRRPGAKTP